MQLSTFQFSGNVLGFIASSKVDSALLKKVHAALDKALETHNLVNWYCENASGDKITFGAIVEDLIYKLSHSDRFSKIAVVSDQVAESVLVKIEDVFLKAEIRFFDLSHRSEALIWVSHL